MSIQKKSLIGNRTAAKKAIIATNVASGSAVCGQDSEPSQECRPRQESADLGKVADLGKRVPTLGKSSRPRQE